MSYASARKLVEALVENYATSKSYPVGWEGRAFTPPVDISQPFLVVFFGKETNGQQVSLGDNPWYRRYSFMQVNINTENGLGRELSDQIGQELTAIILANKLIADGNDTMELFVPELRPVGVREGRWTSVLTVPYQRTSLT